MGLARKFLGLARAPSSFVHNARKLFSYTDGYLMKSDILHKESEFPEKKEGENHCLFFLFSVYCSDDVESYGEK